MKRALPTLLLVVVGACTATPRPGPMSDSTATVPYGAVVEGGAKDATSDGEDAITDAATDGSDTTDAGDPDASVCPFAMTLGTATVANFTPASTSAVGLTMTPDGLTIAYTTGSGAQLHYLDRASTSDPFSSERTLAGTFGTSRLALTSDGLGLAFVNASGKTFGYLARETRAGTFSVAPTNPITAVTLDDVAPGSVRFANPVFARHDTFLLYDVVTSTGYVTYVSTRFTVDDPFAGGAPYIEDLLGKSGEHLVVTQASVDLRTLFLWDEDSQRTELVALAPDNTVDVQTTLGAMRDVQGTADCTTFWYASGSPRKIYSAGRR